MKEIKINIKGEHIQALLEGKKCVYVTMGQPRITLIPDRYGVFMTHDKYMELRRKIGMQLLNSSPDDFLKDFFGDLFEDKLIS